MRLKTEQLHDAGRTRFYFWLLLLCVAAIFLIGLSRRHLWNPDEPREAGMIAEMARSGDWVVPRLNGEPFLEKPPLFYWLSASVFQLLGENYFAARLAAALSAIGGALFVFLLARGMSFSPRSALLCGIMLATAINYWEIGQRCMIDMLLCFFTTGAIVCFYQAVRAPANRASYSVGFVLLLAGAIITKSLVGLAIPLCALGAWLVLERERSINSWLLLLGGAALALIPTAIWIGFVYQELGWSAVHEIVWDNNFGRFTGAGDQHVEAFYYYFEKFPLQFLPWTLLLPIGIYTHFQRSRGPNYSSASLFLLAWFAAPFVLLSISSGKRGLYLLPVFPAAALLAGSVLGEYLDGREQSPSKWISLPARLYGAVALLAALSIGGICIYHRQYLLCLPAVLPALTLGILAYRQLLRKDLPGYFAYFSASLLACFIAISALIYPLFNEGKSYEPLFDYCNELKADGAQFVLFEPSERLRGAAVYYLGQTIAETDKLDDLRKMFAANPKIVALCHSGDAPDEAGIKRLQSFEIGHKKIVLLVRAAD